MVLFGVRSMYVVNLSHHVIIFKEMFQIKFCIVKMFLMITYRCLDAKTLLRFLKMRDPNLRRRHNSVFFVAMDKFELGYKLNE